MAAFVVAHFLSCRSMYWFFGSLPAMQLFVAVPPLLDLDPRGDRNKGAEVIIGKAESGKHVLHWAGALRGDFPPIEGRRGRAGSINVTMHLGLSQHTMHSLAFLASETSFPNFSN